jgi:hypothetical protein
MPIEIRELVIKATVEREQSSTTQGQSPEQRNNVQMQKVINQIIKILKNKNER